MKSTRITVALIAILSLAYTSCIKQDFDSPPDQSTYDPHLAVNCHIADLNKWAIANSSISRSMGDSTISGIVVADDRSGNFYKEIVIQDSTGGIVLKLDSYSLYNDYPVGRKIYVKLKDLYLGSYKQLPQIGYELDQTGTMSSIPTNLRDNYIVKANYPNPLPIQNISAFPLYFLDFGIQYVNCIVQVDNVEFSTGYAGVPYAQMANISSGTSLTLDDCNGHPFVMRNSGYANFQPFLTPTGRGTVIGIFSRYGSTAQLLIRDTSDVRFYGARCNN